MAATLSFMPACRAMAIARSTPLLGRNAAEKRQVVCRTRPEGMHVPRQSVVDRGLPVGPRQRASLVIGNRDQRHLRVLLEERPHIRQRASARAASSRSDTGDAAGKESAGSRVWKWITSNRDTSWKTISISRTWCDSVSRQFSSCHRACGQTGTSRALRLRVTAGEERHLVSLSHQFLGQIGHDSLCAAVKFGRYALVQGSDLCNTHSP